MPCKKCKDENYKWGNTGECKYATKEACEKANPKKYSKMKNIPSPIGKKTYEEYAKELKEYNLSKAEKVELGILQDGEKASEQVKKLIAEAQDTMGFMYNVQSSGDKIVKVILGMRADITKELRNYDARLNTLRDEKKDLFTTGQKLKDAVAELNRISSELTTVAKDMGVDVPGLSNFKKLAAQGKQFDSTIKKAFDKATLPERPSQSF